MEQPWRCEICKKTGSVVYEEHEPWFTVMSRIGRDHRHVSPECKGNAQKVFSDRNLLDKNGVAVVVEAA